MFSIITSVDSTYRVFANSSHSVGGSPLFCRMCYASTPHRDQTLKYPHTRSEYELNGDGWLSTCVARPCRTHSPLPQNLQPFESHPKEPRNNEELPVAAKAVEERKKENRTRKRDIHSTETRTAMLTPDARRGHLCTSTREGMSYMHLRRVLECSP